MTQEELLARQQTLGASEVAAVLGQSPFETATDVYWRKVSPVVETRSSEDQSIGSLMEPVILAWFASRTGKQVAPNRESKTRGILSATPDGIIAGANEGVEAKHTGIADHWGDEGTDEVPAHVLIQAQAQCAVWDFSRVWIPVRIHGFREAWKIYCVHRHAELIETITRITAQWWHKHVAARVPPPGAEIPPIDLLRRLRREPESTIALPEEAAEAVAEYELAKKEIDAAEARKQRAHARIVAMLGVDNAAECGVLPDGTRVTYMQQRAAPSIDRDMLRALAPDVYEKCAKESYYRRLRISYPKKGSSNGN